MRSTRAVSAPVLAGIALLAAMVLLLTHPLEYCGQPATWRPAATVRVAKRLAPTPAPPQKLVYVNVETDKPDLEVGWAEN
jgi:hypothetical protein